MRGENFNCLQKFTVLRRNIDEIHKLGNRHLYSPPLRQYQPEGKQIVIHMNMIFVLNKDTSYTITSIIFSVSYTLLHPNE